MRHQHAKREAVLNVMHCVVCREFEKYLEKASRFLGVGLATSRMWHKQLDDENKLQSCLQAIAERKTYLVPHEGSEQHAKIYYPKLDVWITHYSLFTIQFSLAFSLLSSFVSFRIRPSSVPFCSGLILEGTTFKSFTQILFVLLPRNCYAKTKRLAEGEYGLLTQCIREESFMCTNAVSKVNYYFARNICLKALNVFSWMEYFDI